MATSEPNWTRLFAGECHGCGDSVRTLADRTPAALAADPTVEIRCSCGQITTGTVVKPDEERGR